MVHNSNMKTQTHQKEHKLTMTFSIPSFEKVKIKLPNISDQFVKNLLTKLRIVGFGGARATLKCSFNLCWESLIDLVSAWNPLDSKKQFQKSGKERKSREKILKCSNGNVLCNMSY